MKPGLILLLIVIAAFEGMGQYGKTPITAADLLKIKMADDVLISPDERIAVFSITEMRQDEEKKKDFKYIKQLWVKSLINNEKPRQITFSDENAANPAFSPDGSRLAFTRKVRGVAQLFCLSLKDGGEAVQLTRLPYPVAAPLWGPDGQCLAFSVTLSLSQLYNDTALNPGRSIPKWNQEKPGEITPDPAGDLREVQAWLHQNEVDNKVKVFNNLQFQTENTISPELKFTHIYLMEAIPEAAPKPVTTGFHSFSKAAFLAKDRLIVNGSFNDSQHPDRVLEKGIYEVTLDGSGPVAIIDAKDSLSTIAAVSSSGTRIAFQQQKPNTLTVPVLQVMYFDGTVRKKLVIDFDRTKEQFKFSSDEKYLYFNSMSNGGKVLYSVDLHTLHVQALTSEDDGITSFDVAGNHLLYAKTGAGNPSELFCANAVARNERQLTALNTDWLKEKYISFPDKKKIVNAKGQQVDYWIMKPVNFNPERKYPLLVEIHGGPAYMFGPGDPTMWHEFQFFCSKGYGVLYSNPRGSGGYGAAFMQGAYRDWSAGPASDVLQALNDVQSRKWIDSSRLFLTGGSYGGYLTCWMIAHDNRFRAASSQRGVYDLNTFFGEGNVWRMVPRYFGGYPWDTAVRRILEWESPVNYAQNIHTPYIIFHGENDYRTGVIQSEMLYKSLKVMGKQVEYIRHPGADHELIRTGDIRQRLDQLLRIYEFFERFRSYPSAKPDAATAVW